MREIKFRAWTGTGYAYGGFSIYATAGNIIFDFPWIDENSIIEQYTGLKDEDGKEIYEGDILRGSFGIPARVVISAVIYSESAYIINTPDVNPKMCTLKVAIDCLQPRIIGNIHENPELLEEK